jgi:hypothetical protein
MGFVEWDAALSANLDLWKWELGIYPKWFKVRVIAFHNMRNVVATHTEDQKAIEMEREARRKKR